MQLQQALDNFYLFVGLDNDEAPLPSQQSHVEASCDNGCTQKRTRFVTANRLSIIIKLFRFSKKKEEKRGPPPPFMPWLLH